MQIEIVVEGIDTLGAYASIPIAYQIVEVLDPDSPSDSGGLLPFTSTVIDVPVVKDYDAEPGNHPLDWRWLGKGECAGVRSGTPNRFNARRPTPNPRHDARDSHED